MTREEKAIALYCLKASSDYHSEVCEECIKYPNCDHTIQDDVTETIIKALEQESSEDAISRKEVLEMIEQIQDAGGFIGYNTYSEAFDKADNMPSVILTRKKGKWVKEYDNSALDGLYHCSICGRKLWIPKEQSFSDYPYCHCGAEMESEV